MKTRTIEFVVGIFMVAGLVALILLAFKVSGLVAFGTGQYYTLTANFDNIGNLKVRAPVSISGVRVGQVSGISINRNNFRAEVILHIEKKMNTLPIDTSASIFTQGILGSNYINLTPGFEQKNLKNGDRIEITHSALILENLIGQLIYNLKGNDNTDVTAFKNKAKKGVTNGSS